MDNILVDQLLEQFLFSGCNFVVAKGKSVVKVSFSVLFGDFLQWPFASVSSELSYRIQKEGFDYLDAPIRRITSADAPMHYAPNLTALAIPDVTRTVKLIKEVMHQYK